MPNKAFDAWRDARQGELAAPDSWLGLVGLFWLDTGLNSVGSEPGSSVLLPSGAAHLGDLEWSSAAILWRPRDGVAVILETDHDGQPTVIDHGNLSFFVVERDGRLAVRLRDRHWADGKTFAGVPCFEFDPAWQIEAQWLPLSPPLLMEVPNVSGELKRVEVAWRAVFSLQGQEFSLLPMSVGPEGVFFVFRDRTSGKETYGAGRFLKTAPVREGRIALDFNRAFNPPCAFTPFATCPLPPPENWLPVAIPVGEMKPSASGH